MDYIELTETVETFIADDDTKKKSYQKKYRCPYCSETFERNKLHIHIQNKHEDMIPEGHTALRVAFNQINHKTEGYCIICRNISPWNEDKGRYERLCKNPKCHQQYKKMVAERNKKVYGVERLQTDERYNEFVQKKALSGRKISGVYKFKDGGSHQYVGSYEKNFLEFMDKIMNCSSEDLVEPGPGISYEFEGKKHLYLPDFFYIPYQLLIEIKDGGDNPNNHPHRAEDEKKNKAKEAAVKKLNKYSYVRVVNNDFSQLLTAMAVLKYNMQDNDTTPVVMTHESAILESEDKSVLEKDHKQKGAMKLSELKFNENNKHYKIRRCVGNDSYYLTWNTNNGLPVARIEVGQKPLDDGYRWIDNLNINKKYRGYGLGRQIIEFVKSKYKAGALGVYKDNEIAINLYKQCGFKIGNPPNEGIDECYYMYYFPNQEKINKESAILESEQKSTLDKNHKQKGSKKLSEFKLNVTERDNSDKTLKRLVLSWTDDNKTIALVTVDKTPREEDGQWYRWFGHFQINKSYRGYGLGKQIVEFIKKKYKAGALAVYKDNEIAVRLYKQCSFIIGKETDTSYWMYYPPNREKVYNESMVLESEDKSVLEKDHKQKGSMKLSDLKLEVKNTNYSKDEKDFGAFKCFSLKWFTKDGRRHVAHVDVDQSPANDGYYWFGNFGVIKEYRGNGLGKQIVEFIKSKYKAGALGVAKDNEIAIRLYKQCGFKELERKDPKGKYLYLYYPPNKEKNIEKINEVTKIKRIKELYFISDKDFDNKILKPRVPNHLSNRRGEEENKTGRICFAPTIKECLRAIPQNDVKKGKEFYVHIPKGKYTVYRPSTKEVADSVVTNEHWICEPVKLECIGKIKLMDKYDSGEIFSYKGEDFTVYDWNYDWIEKKNTEKALKESLEDIDQKFIGLDKQSAIINLNTILNESVINESILFNDDDLYYNKDKFDSGEINLLFITGLSGSGKTTLSKMYEDIGCAVVHLDRLLGFYIDNFSEKSRANDMIKSFYLGPGKIFIEKRDGRYFNKYHLNKEKNYEIIKTFIDYAIQYAQRHPSQQFVIEGTYIAIYTNVLSPEYFQNYAIIIKNTPICKSILQASDRDGIEDYNNLADHYNDLTISRFTNFYNYYNSKSQDLVETNMTGTIQAALPNESNGTKYYLVQHLQNNVFSHGLTKDPAQNTLYEVEPMEDDERYYKVSKTTKDKIDSDYKTFKIKNTELAQEIYNELAAIYQSGNSVIYDTECKTSYLYNKLTEGGYLYDPDQLLIDPRFRLVDNPKSIKEECHELYSYLTNTNNIDLLEAQIHALYEQIKASNSLEIEHNKWIYSIATLQLEMQKPHSSKAKEKIRNTILELGWIPDIPITKESFRLFENYCAQIPLYEEIDLTNQSSLSDIYLSEAGQLQKEKVPVFIVLTHSIETHMKNIVGKAIQWYTNSKWDHAEIGFDSSLDLLYTFRTGGFFISGIDYWLEENKYAPLEIKVNVLWVTPAQREKMIQTIKYYMHNIRKTSYALYNIVNIFFKRALLPFDNKFERICSQFVYTLCNIGKFDLKKPSSFVRPADLDEHRKLYKVYEGPVEKYRKFKVDRIITDLQNKLFNK